jgi:hypothetical protein
MADKYADKLFRIIDDNVYIGYDYYQDCKEICGIKVAVNRIIGFINKQQQKKSEIKNKKFTKKIERIANLYNLIDVHRRNIVLLEGDLEGDLVYSNCKEIYNNINSEHEKIRKYDTYIKRELGL